MVVVTTTSESDPEDAGTDVNGSAGVEFGGSISEVPNQEVGVLNLKASVKLNLFHILTLIVSTPDVLLSPV